MKYINTPAGKFQIFLNGKPMEFDAKMHSPYLYRNESDSSIAITACYEMYVSCLDMGIGDIIDARFECGDFSYDGGGEYRDNAVGCVGEYIVGIGVPDNECVTLENGIQWLPYENYGLVDSGFIFRITDDPKGYTSHPRQTEIRFVIAWELSSKEYAWNIVSFMTS